MRANTHLGKPARFAAIFSSVLFTAGLMASAQSSTSALSGHGRDRIVYSQSLPKSDGEHLKITVVEVTYAPGESSLPHSHPCPVVGYVVVGALRMKVKGEAEKIYKAGEGFYEAPNGVHEVSANASATTPAKFIAYFLCDHEVQLSVAPSMSSQGERQ